LAGSPLDEVRAPVLPALDEEERRRILAADHSTIDADVHHARVRIPRHDAGERVDVAPAFEVMPLRDWKLRLVDGIAPDDDLLHRPRCDHDWSNRLAVLLHNVLDELAIGDFTLKTEGESEA